MSAVYFLVCSDFDRVKIGTSCALSEIVKQAHRMCCAPTDFADVRVHGEWFYYRVIADEIAEIIRLRGARLTHVIRREARRRRMRESARRDAQMRGEERRRVRVARDEVKYERRLKALAAFNHARGARESLSGCTLFEIIKRAGVELDDLGALAAMLREDGWRSSRAKPSLWYAPGTPVRQNNVVTTSEIRQVRELLDAGLRYVDVAQRLNVSYHRVYAVAHREVR